MLATGCGDPLAHGSTPRPLLALGLRRRRARPGGACQVGEGGIVEDYGCQARRAHIVVVSSTVVVVMTAELLDR
jgi:hypothetical protein